MANTDIIVQIFIVIFLISMHEVGHIVATMFFKQKIQGIKITPLGFFLKIKDFEKLSTIRKTLILLAGPLVNISISVFFYTYNYIFTFFWQASLAIAIFNLLPIYPLDGGRIICAVLSKKIGTINANILVKKFGDIIIVVIFLLGVIQALLFMPNLSLIFLCVFLKNSSNKHYKEIAETFYLITLQGYKLRDTIPSIKFLFASENEDITKIVNKFNHETFHIIYFFNEKKIVNIMDEYEILEVLLNGGSDKYSGG